MSTTIYIQPRGKLTVTCDTEPSPSGALWLSVYADDDRVEIMLGHTDGERIAAIDNVVEALQTSRSAALARLAKAEWDATPALAPETITVTHASQRVDMSPSYRAEMADAGRGGQVA